MLKKIKILNILIINHNLYRRSIDLIYFTINEGYNFYPKTRYIRIYVYLMTLVFEILLLTFTKYVSNATFINSKKNTKRISNKNN